MYCFVICAALLTAAIPSFAQTTVWKSDLSHSRLSFTVTHQGFSSISGVFKEFTAIVSASKEDFSDASVALTAVVASLNTETPARDAHLRSKDFFDAAAYPQINFRSTGIRNTTGVKGRYWLTGDLTLHGITRPVTVELWFRGTNSHPENKVTKAGFQVSGVINRSDFGVGPSDPFDISTEVLIRADGEFIRQ